MEYEVRTAEILSHASYAPSIGHLMTSAGVRFRARNVPLSAEALRTSG